MIPPIQISVNPLLDFMKSQKLGTNEETSCVEDVLVVCSAFRAWSILSSVARRDEDVESQFFRQSRDGLLERREGGCTLDILCCTLDR